MEYLSEHVQKQGLFYKTDDHSYVFQTKALFKLNIFQVNLMGNVYKQFFLRNIVGCGGNRNPKHTIFVGIISSPKFRRNGLCCSHVLIIMELQSTTQNSFKLHNRCFYEGALKLLHQKPWKISRKLHVIEFPFNKIIRLHSTAYYLIKKSPADTIECWLL